MIKNKNLIIIIISLVFSVITGIITKDLLVGGTILFMSIMNSYLASIGKKANYITGFISCLLTGYVSLKNNLYGLFFFYIFIFAPLQVHGFISWKNNQDENSNVKVREFTFKNSIIIILSCIIGSFIVGYLLTLIPNQKLAFMDAASNCINLCGVILMILRFKEAWWVWLANNIIDLIIWIIMLVNNGPSSWMMLLSSLVYLLINIYGIIKWSINAKTDKRREALV